MKKLYKVAVVGCGGISKNHLNAISFLDNVKVVALCDIKPERAYEKREMFGLDSKIYESFDKMLECEELDAIHISTPHYLHAPMTVAALKRDINVFLEKPMCITNEEALIMLDAEKASKGRVCVCFQNRFNPGTVAAKEIINNDGGPISAFCSIFWERNEPYYTESGWRGSIETEGGGVMINQAIHSVDLLCEFLGKPLTLCATKANHHLKGIIDVEDSCEGMIKFDSGKIGNFYATTAFCGYDYTLVFVLTKNHKIELRNGNLFVDNKLLTEEDTKSYVGKAAYGNGHKYLIKKFYDALENDSEMPVSLESAQYAVRILLAAYKSGDVEIKV